MRPAHSAYLRTIVPDNKNTWYSVTLYVPLADATIFKHTGKATLHNDIGNRRCADVRRNNEKQKQEEPRNVCGHSEYGLVCSAWGRVSGVWSSVDPDLNKPTAKSPRLVSFRSENAVQNNFDR